MAEASKTINQSRIRLGQLMGPEHANHLGNVHGGIIMKMVDEAGAIAAMRHAGAPVVTVAMDQMTFMEPILIGYIVTLDAEPTYAGTTSIETRVVVTAENPITGAKTQTNMAYLVYVAIDLAGRPQPVPRLVASSEDEEQIMADARERQAYRKQQRKREEERASQRR
jgi:uncharacterized protein (TIGR00369 family)